jgi:hypothetical protein
MDAYYSLSQDDYNKYIFSGLTLLGDPELPIWMNNPFSFIVSYPTKILPGSSSFTVQVENLTGGNIENAYVCLWKEDEVYLTNYTDSGGNVIFNPSPSTEGNMTITVTKQDYIPYEGNIIVTYRQPPSNPIIDGPNNLKVDEEGTFTVSSIDPEDNQINYYIDWGDGNIMDWDGPYNSAEDVIYQHTWTSKDTYIIRVKAKDTFDFESDWRDFEIKITNPRPIFTINHLIRVHFSRFTNLFPIIRLLLIQMV